MSEKPPENIDTSKYQIFLCSSPGNLPFSFVPHHWFVINKLGSLSRWEVLFRTITGKNVRGHLYKNFLPPFLGIEIVPFVGKYFWPCGIIGCAESDVAKRMAEFIEKSPDDYQFCDHYFLTGPNSNTYVQWVLDNFPEFELKLPWNAIGKNYHYAK